ncbi:MAG TPA: branched-chain amino acid ABC transporter substrate-binding protein [Dongiaceae bacterium]
MRIRFIHLACIALPFLLSACASDSAPSGKQPQPSSSEIVIGVAGPMTGDIAPFGAQLRRGAQQAVADLNAQGGVLGKHVRLVIGDDQCSPPRAVSIANALTKQGAVFVAGHFCSGSSIPASKVYDEAGVLQITPSSTNPQLTENGIPTLFRTCGNDDMQGPFAGKWIAENYAGRNVAILDDGSTYGRRIADEAARSLGASGMKAVVRDSYAQKLKDFSALVAKLKEAKVAIAYVGGYHNSVGLLIRQAREQGFTGDFAGADALYTSEFWAIAGTAGEGVRFTDASSQVNFVSAKSVVETFRASNYEPEGYTLSAYAAVQAWAAGAEIAGSTEAAKVAKALHENVIPTVIGDLSWDAKGDLTHVNYAWFVWHKGQVSEEP